MLKQKKVSIKKSSAKPSLTNFINQHQMIKEQIKQVKNTNFFKPHAKILKHNQTRSFLRQIDNSLNREGDISSRKDRLAHYRLLLNYGRNFTLNQVKQEDHLFKCIVQSIRTQEPKISQYTVTKFKRFLVLRDRPNTSLGLQNTGHNDKSSICQGQLIFQPSKTEQDMIKNARRMSKSRALMNFSQIYRYDSNQRLRYHHEKPILRNSIHLSARTMPIQEKQNKPKSTIIKSIQKKFLPCRIKKQKSIKQIKRIYKVQQQFEIAAWDFQ